MRWRQGQIRFRLEDARIVVSTHNMTKAQKTYSAFIGTLKWTVPLVAVIVLIIILMIS